MWVCCIVHTNIRFAVRHSMAERWITYNTQAVMKATPGMLLQAKDKRVPVYFVSIPRPPAEQHHFVTAGRKTAGWDHEREVGLGVQHLDGKLPDHGSRAGPKLAFVM